MRLRMRIAENIKESILCHSISIMSFRACFCVRFSGFEANIVFFWFCKEKYFCEITKA